MVTTSTSITSEKTFCLTPRSEELSHELALRFASKCYSHLEITHFKDNFKSLADHQEDVEYWKEDTLNKFLCLPEPIGAGPVIYQMAGEFPAVVLGPCWGRLVVSVGDQFAA